MCGGCSTVSVLGGEGTVEGAAGLVTLCYTVFAQGYSLSLAAAALACMMHSHESSCQPALTPSLHQWPLSTTAGVLPHGHSLQPLGQLPPHVLSRD